MDSRLFVRQGVALDHRVARVLPTKQDNLQSPSAVNARCDLHACLPSQFKSLLSSRKGRTSFSSLRTSAMTSATVFDSSSRLPTRLPCRSSLSSGVTCSSSPLSGRCSHHCQDSANAACHCLLMRLQQCQPTRDRSAGREHPMQRTGKAQRKRQHQPVNRCSARHPHTSSISSTVRASSGRASSMVAVAASAASKTLSRPLASIWRAILVQMYTRSSSATPATGFH